MTEQRTKILDQKKIEAKIKRMAYEIAEKNFKEEALIIIGIEPNGSALAKLILKDLNEIIDKQTHFIALNIKDENSITEINSFLKSVKNIGKTSLIVIDDVANTGKTMAYALKPLLNFAPKKIQTAVLVDRKHKNFPIKSDYIGLQLSTNLQEYIEVDLEKMEVCLR